MASHYSKKGSVTWNTRDEQWIATIQIDGRGRAFHSPCKTDCEEWLDIMRNDGNDSRFRHQAKDNPIEDIEQMGGTNPRQVPGFPHYYLTDEGRLYSVKGRLAIIIKPQRGRYLRLNEGHDSVSVTLERLEYCIDHNVSPTTLSHCKLSVKRGEAGLQLMDTTEYIKQCTRRHYEQRWAHAEVFIRENIRWNTALLAYYEGDINRLTQLRQILDNRRDHLEAYIRDTLRVADPVRLQYIADETISETILRVSEKSCLVSSPLSYMEGIARHINAAIRECRGKVFNDGNVFHVKGDLTKVSRKKTAYNS